MLFPTTIPFGSGPEFQRSRLLEPGRVSRSANLRPLALGGIPVRGSDTHAYRPHAVCLSAGCIAGPSVINPLSLRDGPQGSPPSPQTCPPRGRLPVTLTVFFRAALLSMAPALSQDLEGWNQNPVGPRQRRHGHDGLLVRSRPLVARTLDHISQIALCRPSMFSYSHEATATPAALSPQPKAQTSSNHASQLPRHYPNAVCPPIMVPGSAKTDGPLLTSLYASPRT